jgi:UDP-galactopyranose mutase
MSRGQNTERSNNMRIGNSSFDRVEEFKYLETTLINQNTIQEEIKSRLNLRNACYYSLQNILSSRLLSRYLKIKIYRTIILTVIWIGVKLGRWHWTQAEGVQELGTEETIWAWELRGNRGVEETA